MHRSGVCLGAALLLAIASPCYPQDGNRRNALADGAWAMQFRISNNFSLQNFSGSVISIKRHSSPGSALRLGVNLSLGQRDLERQFAISDTTFLDTITVSEDSDSYGFGVNLQYLGYKHPDSRVSLFWGLGPSFSYSKLVGRAADVESGRTMESDNRNWFVGLLGNLGVEWFPTRDLGVHAEYGLSGGYTSDRSEDSRQEPGLSVMDTLEGDGWRIGGGNVLFGLSVYF